MSNCNCEPKTYNIGMGCCQPVLAPIENYYTKYQIDKMLEDIESGITSGCCITPEEVDDKISSAKTEIENEIPSLSGYATEQWVTDQNYITGVDLSNYATKSEIPTVPTNVSAFNNDAGYLTEHQSLSAYSTTSEVNAAINQATSGKANSSDVITNIKSNPSKGKAAISYTKNGTNTNVDVFETPVGSGLEYDKATKQLSLNLVAGTNVSIVNNVISATDTTYSAGDGIQISGNTISTTTKFQCLTEQEWASISGNPDTNTVYLIH